MFEINDRVGTECNATDIIYSKYCTKSRITPWYRAVFYTREKVNFWKYEHNSRHILLSKLPSILFYINFLGPENVISQQVIMPL